MLHQQNFQQNRNLLYIHVCELMFQKVLYTDTSFRVQRTNAIGAATQPTRHKHLNAVMIYLMIEGTYDLYIYVKNVEYIIMVHNYIEWCFN